MDVKSFIEGGTPFERADVGADRSAARVSLLEDLVERIANGVHMCQMCRHRAAAHVHRAAVDGAIRGICSTCRGDVDLNDRIAESKRIKNLMCRR